MNILFSDRFTEEVAELGNMADWVGLDTGNASNNQPFWESVQETYEGQYEAYDNMHFVQDKALNDLYFTNFSKVVLIAEKNSRNKEEAQCRV